MPIRRTYTASGRSLPRAGRLEIVSDFREKYVRGRERREMTVAELAAEVLRIQEAARSPSIRTWRVAHDRLVATIGEMSTRDPELPSCLDGVIRWTRSSAHGKGGRPVSDSTLARDRALYHSIWAHAIRTGAAETNAVDAMTECPSRTPRDPMRPALEVLSMRDLTRLCFSLEIPRHHRLLWRAYVIWGLRGGEAYGVEWRDAISDTVIAQRIVDDLTGKPVERTKTNTIRHLPLVPGFDGGIALLRDCRLAYLDELGRPPAPEEPIFPRWIWVVKRAARHWTNERAREAWRAALAKLKIADPSSGRRRLHALRHSYITHAAGTFGAPAEVLREITHTRAVAPRDAFDRYRHVSREAIFAAAAAWRFDRQTLAEMGIEVIE